MTTPHSQNNADLAAASIPDESSEDEFQSLDSSEVNSESSGRLHENKTVGCDIQMKLTLEQSKVEHQRHQQKLQEEEEEQLKRALALSLIDK